MVKIIVPISCLYTIRCSALQEQGFDLCCELCNDWSVMERPASTIGMYS